MNSVVFHPTDGTRLASGSSDSSVRVWDWAAGTCVATLEGHGGCMFSVAFHPTDGTRLASGGGEDGSVRVWDWAAGTCVATLEGHGHSVNSVAYNPRDGRLASVSYDRTIRIMNVVV